MKRLIYLSYPIDNAQLTENQIAWINGGKVRLLGHADIPAAAVFDPGDAFLVRHGAEPDAAISKVNNAAIDAADAVLAFMPRGVSSIGVPMEIAQAGMVGKPVAVLSDSYSWALRMDRDNVRIFSEGDLDAAIEWLLSFEDWEPSISDDLPFVGLPELGPTRAYADDAGLDLYVSERTTLIWGEFKDVPLGINVALPEWSWGFLVGRSSTFRKRGVEVMPGIIDTGWRGELFAACIWRPDQLRDEDIIQNPGSYTLEAGERIAQLIIIPNGTRDVTPVRVDVLPPHARGENGFGSSGT